MLPPAQPISPYRQPQNRATDHPLLIGGECLRAEVTGTLLRIGACTRAGAASCPACGRSSRRRTAAMQAIASRSTLLRLVMAATDPRHPPRGSWGITGRG